MEVRPLRIEMKAGKVLCSRMLPTGHRKRDYLIPVTQLLHTHKPDPGAVPVRAEEAPAISKVQQVVELRAPVSSVSPRELPEGLVYDSDTGVVLKRMAGVVAMAKALDSAVNEEHYGAPWRYFMAAVAMYPELKDFKRVLAQLEIDRRKLVITNVADMASKT
jgi:hypothetical protein